jgi:hypothetical protein
VKPRIFKGKYFWGWHIEFPQRGDNFAAHWSEATWKGAMEAVKAWYSEGIEGLNKREKARYPNS